MSIAGTAKIPSGHSGGAVQFVFKVTVFTGIIEAVGHIAALEHHAGDVRLCIASGGLNLCDQHLGEQRVGDSIAVNGVCLTITRLTHDRFCADVSAETQSCTTFAELAAGAQVNLERALRPDARLGGHWVSGHVDGVGIVTQCYADGLSTRLHIRVPDGLARYIAVKGSVCVDGVSLTVNTVQGAEFAVNLVPHTLQATTLNELAAGARVNIEVDIIARYLERLLLGNAAAVADAHTARSPHADQ